ncbi:HET-domain-containing protein, partial [Thozetella sp. PMI_491]
MRLIDTSTLELQEFPSEDRLKYAVLSHNWGDGEVTFGDMTSPATRKAKRGWAKIQKTCQLAKSAGLKYAWVDTCCIDKSSSSELSESINSMFRWYAAAHVCYAYLEDLSPHESIEQGLPACRWMTRGWTLQELIAPRDVRFFDSTWSHRGSKADLESVLEEYTHIPASILQGKQVLSNLAIAMRMSWAANRETTRVEDMAYSLMGLFDVNMPLLYGEGIKAFRRLQEEILRRTNDMSILAW